MRDEAQAVIIGGGVAGCSIAYHLTQMGWRDIVLVERGTLTGGSTHRAAGLIGQLRGTYNLTRMIMNSVELYGRLLQETGIDPDWRQVGSLRLASSTLRMEEIRRLVSQAKAFGLDVELLTPREAIELCPIIGDHDLVGAAWIPRDGRTNPIDTTRASRNTTWWGSGSSPRMMNAPLTVAGNRSNLARTETGSLTPPPVTSPAPTTAGTPAAPA